VRRGEPRLAGHAEQRHGREGSLNGGQGWFGIFRNRQGGIGVSVTLSILAVALGSAVLFDAGRAHLASVRVSRALDAGARALAGIDAGPRMSDALVVNHFYDNLPTKDYGLAVSVWLENKGDFRKVDVRTEVDTVVLRYIGRPRFVFRASGRVPSNIVWLVHPDI